MRSGPVELQPAREFIQRMHALETELQQARQQQRRQRTDASARWGLEAGPPLQQEEGWFLTYLDMMTLLLVAMIVMLAFSGSLDHQKAGAKDSAVTSAVNTTHQPTPASPASLALPMLAMAESGVHSSLPSPDYFAPYPAAPASDFLRATYPADSLAALASAYPTPMDLMPPTPEPAPVLPEAAVDAAAPPPPTALPGNNQATVITETVAPVVAIEAAAPAPAAASAGTPVPASVAPPEPNPHSEGESLAADLALDKLGSEVEVIVNQRSVSLRVNSEILFGTGQADLSPHGQDVLKRMAKLLTSKGYDIVVEGHTDSIPVRSNSRYPSNWELSTDRAGSVVRFLLANGIDKAHLRAVGFADTRPIATNQDATGRSRNRRVELVVEKGQSAPEPSASPAAGSEQPALDKPQTGQSSVAGQPSGHTASDNAAAPSETDLILQQAQGRPETPDGLMNSPTE